MICCTKRATQALRPAASRFRSFVPRASAQEEQEAAPPAPAPQPERRPGPPPPGARRGMPPRGPPGTIMGPDGQPLKVVPVEKASEDAWNSVAFIDRGESETSFGKAALLVGGDLAALIVFAAVGRANHGEIVGLETIATALPFAIGWFTSASLLGGFGASAQSGDVKSAAATAAKCWAVGTPLGLALRGLSKGAVPPTPFIIVSMAATGVLLVGWRSALAAATKKDPVPKDIKSQLAARKNKSGNPFEFMELLFSLVRRW